MKKKTNSLLEPLASLALLFAKTGAGTTCYGLFCQPKFPKKLHK